jgi:hypothetical protein
LSSIEPSRAGPREFHLVHPGHYAPFGYPYRERAGRFIARFFPSANREEAIFPHGELFRVERDPNDHLSFRTGEHFRPGRHVTLLVPAAPFAELLPAIANLEIAGPVTNHIELARWLWVGAEEIRTGWNIAQLSSRVLRGRARAAATCVPSGRAGHVPGRCGTGLGAPASGSIGGCGGRRR